MHRVRLLVVGMTLLSLGFAPTALAGAYIVSGTASAGADLGASWDTSGPPTSFSDNVFFESADLTLRARGNTNNWHGWGAVGWNLASGATTARFVAGGHSTEGYNGAIGSGGWIYGRGHSDFEATVTLDQGYSYTSVTSGTGVDGIYGASGFLPSGSYTFSGGTLGGPEAFTFDISLTPSHIPTPQQIMANAFTSPGVYWDPVKKLYWVEYEFRPNYGLTLGNAAQLCGVDHFNFLNRIAAVPLDWEVRDNGVIVKESGEVLPAPGLPDPPLGTRMIDDPGAPFGTRWILPQPIVTTPKFDDLNPGYYDDDILTTQAAKNESVLRFKDSPTAYPGMYRDGQVQVFYTELVGVDANGNIVQHYGGLIPGADFRWSTDQTAGFWNGEHWTGGIFLAGDPDWPGRPPRVSGGIYLGAPPITEIPEPGTLALTGLGLLAFAVIRRARRARARR